MTVDYDKLQGATKELHDSIRSPEASCEVVVLAFEPEGEPQIGVTFCSSIEDLALTVELVSIWVRNMPPGVGACNACNACKVEAEFGTQEDPHPLAPKFHTCDPARVPRLEDADLGTEREVARLEAVLRYISAHCEDADMVRDFVSRGLRGKSVP